MIVEKSDATRLMISKPFVTSAVRSVQRGLYLGGGTLSLSGRYASQQGS